MCVVIGKYFENIGWVGIKNRDRNYIPEISFKKTHANGLEILYFWDLNSPKQKTWVEILSNRILYKNLRNDNPDDDLPFIGKLTHSVKAAKK